MEFWQKSWIIKDHNSVTNRQKFTPNNPNLNLVNINAYAKFGQIPSIRSQDIERKRSRNHNLKTVYQPYFICGGYKSNIKTCIFIVNIIGKCGHHLE